MVERTCSVDGCDRNKIVARGMCPIHYHRTMRGHPLDAPMRRPRGMTHVEAFRHVMPEDPPADECWLWRGSVDRNGYGRIMFIRRTYFAHRVAHELFIGPIPDGLGVCHRCDNPPCCNPAHLYAGTQKDNVRDMVTRDRSTRGHPRPQCRGELHHGAVLTSAECAQIRRRYEQGDIRQRDLAELYGVSAPLISMVARGLRS